MADIFERIDHLTEFEICDVVEAVIDKYRSLFPDWEIVLVSISKKQNRTDQIDSLIKLMEKLKTSP